MGLTAKADIEVAFEQLRTHNLKALFIHSLGWLAPSVASPTQLSNQDCFPIAQRDSVVVWHVPLASETRFTPVLRRQIYQTLLDAAVEAPLVIFSSADQRRSLWCQSLDESALYAVGQPMSLWLFRLRRFLKATQGLFPSVAIASLQDETFEGLARDIERGIVGIDSVEARQQYSVLLLQRLIFLQQLQQKGWLAGDTWYLQTRFGELQSEEIQGSELQGSELQGSDEVQDRFFRSCLQPLFQALSLPAIEHSVSLKESIGLVPSVGLFFQRSRLEENYDAMTIADSAFENVLGWLSEQASADTLNPWMDGALGYWLERYWRRRMGVTPVGVGQSHLTQRLCQGTLDTLLLARLSELTPAQKTAAQKTAVQKMPAEQTLNDVLFEARPQVYRYLIQEILPSLRLCDPYCGSGQLLVAFHQRLSDIFSIVTGYIQQTQDAQLKIWHATLTDRPAIDRPTSYSLEPSEEVDTGVVLRNIQERVLKNTIFGVAATDAIANSAHFQLLLHFVDTAQSIEAVESLIDLEFNVMAGDPLVGLITVDEERFDQINTSGEGSVLQGNLLQPLAADSYQAILGEKNVALEYYQSRSQVLASAHHIPPYARAALLREEILTLNRKAQQKLDNLLLSHMSQQLGIRYRETQLTDKPIRRPLTLADIKTLRSFHCGYHFNSVMRQGGFDIVACLPPWGALSPTVEEFLLRHRDLAERDGLTSKTLKTSKQALKQLAPDVAEAWLRYKDRYAYLTEYVYLSELYPQQKSIAEGKKKRSPLNQTALFIEQCSNLLAKKGIGAVLVSTELLQDEWLTPFLSVSSDKLSKERIDFDDVSVVDVDNAQEESAVFTWTKRC